jgi:hypothetical protein
MTCAAATRRFTTPAGDHGASHGGLPRSVPSWEGRLREPRSGSASPPVADPAVRAKATWYRLSGSWSGQAEIAEQSSPEVDDRFRDRDAAGESAAQLWLVLRPGPGVQLRPSG